MYAVIQTGGKQYRVRPGDVIVVEKLDGDVGSEVSFDSVLMMGGGEKGVSLGSALKGALVRATLIETRKGEKVKVFKKIRRQGYRRTQGHRQFESVLRITGLEGGGEKAKWDGEVDLTPRATLVARARGLAPVETAEPKAKPAKAAKATAPKASAPKAAAAKPAKAPVEAPVDEAAMMDTPVSEQVAEKPAKAKAAPKAEAAPAKTAEKSEPKAKAEAKAPAAKAKAEPKAEAAPKKAAAPKAAKADSDSKPKAPAKAKPAPKAGK